MGRHQTEILVIGTGLAGTTAALTAADEGKKITILTKTNELKSGNTPHAQGGIVYKGLEDSPEKLKKDIINAGAGHCWEIAVNQLCNEGPSLVKKLLIDKYSVDFDSSKNGDGLNRASEAAHSDSRILHSKDQTGSSIQDAIIDAMLTHKNITILTSHTAVDLLTLSHNSINTTDIYKKPGCFGAMVLNNNNGDVSPIYANRTILASGGLGQVFLHTTNPEESQGDGIAMAWRAGARCFNLEYVQFHPTTLFHDSGRFLISEAVRGEGGKLIDVNGAAFMEKIHIDGAMAPRDVVARGIHQSMLATGHPCVYLDISHKSATWLNKRFPHIVKTCSDRGIDVTKEPIPVVPSAHYSCGGIGVNLQGHTSLKRLYAIGEVACTGAHGANRLASTSLLEALVWGYFSGKDVSVMQDGDDYFPEIHPWVLEKKEIDPALIAQDWLTIKNTMWNYVGLVRTPQRLRRAQTILRHLQSEIEVFYQRAKLTPEIIGLRNGVQTANALVSAAMESRDSQGTHFIQSDE